MVPSIILLAALLAQSQQTSQTTVVKQNVNVSNVTVETTNSQTTDVKTEVSLPGQTESVSPVEVEIRPTEKTMKVTTEINQASTQVSISPQDTEMTLVKIASSPTSSQIEIKQTTEGPLKIETETTSATTSLPVKVVENQVQAEVNGAWETITSPDKIEMTVEASLPYPTITKKIELVGCQTQTGSPTNCEATYQTESEGETRLFGIIKVHPTIKCEVGATSGKIRRMEKPWYLKLFPFVFF